MAERPKVKHGVIYDAGASALLNEQFQLQQLKDQGFHVQSLQDVVEQRLEDCVDGQEEARLAELRKELGTMVTIHKN